MGKKSKKRREQARRRSADVKAAHETLAAKLSPVDMNDIRLVARENREREENRERARAAVATNPERHLPFPPTWPEVAEADHQMLPVSSRPPLGWRPLEAEAATVRQYYVEHPEQWEAEYGITHYKSFGADTILTGGPSAYDLRNIQHFQALPSIVKWKKLCMQNAALTYGLIKRLPESQVHYIVDQVKAEQSHLLYHQAMWRGHGRRVYVLDRTTYELLAATPLPKLPASILSMPYHSFYLKLPEHVFQFEVNDERTGQCDKAFAEGICVAMDKIDPDYAGTRELAFTVMGEHDPKSLGTTDAIDPLNRHIAATFKSEARNTAFISARLGADALLSNVQIGTDNVRAAPVMDLTGPLVDRYMLGNPDMGTLVPRVVIGLLLYLASEHPDITPIHPTARREVESFRNPAKRRKAEQANARSTRLTMLYVGRNLRDEIEKEKESVRQSLATAGRTLDHPVWVRGHWRLQPVGVGRQLRKTIWIRPYVKGPDVADSLAIRAAKIQRAEHATT